MSKFLFEFPSWLATSEYSSKRCSFILRQYSRWNFIGCCVIKEKPNLIVCLNSYYISWQISINVFWFVVNVSVLFSSCISLFLFANRISLRDFWYTKKKNAHTQKHNVNPLKCVNGKNHAGMTTTTTTKRQAHFKFVISLGAIKMARERCASLDTLCAYARHICGGKKRQYMNIWYIKSFVDKWLLR